MNWLDLLAPRSCAFCEVRLQDQENSICCGCLADLPWLDTMLSPTPGIFECRIAILRYAFPVDAAIKAFKFQRRLFYGPAFAEILCRAASQVPEDVDVVVPVPLHWRRKAFRGFNQASEIARPFARRLGVPLVKGLRRLRSTPFQSGLDARERTRNLHRAFSIRGKFDGSHALLVDDVFTTGATVIAAAECLKQGGARTVSVITLAKTGG